MNTNQTELKLKNIIVKSNAEFRYLNFLKELNFLLKNNQYVSFNELVKKHKIARGLLASMQELKIVKKLSPRKFKWVGKKPSLEMANEILKNQRDRVGFRAVQIRNRTRKPRTITKEISNEIKVASSTPRKIRTPRKVSTLKPAEKIIKISIFWGFLKFEI